MRVLKFGGTSLGNATRIRNAAEIIEQNQPCIVVLSAMYGITNKLHEIVEFAKDKKYEAAKTKLNEIKTSFHSVQYELFGSDESAFDDYFNEVCQNIISENRSTSEVNRFITSGEAVTVRLMQQYLVSNKLDADIISAPEYMILDEQEEPNKEIIRDLLSIKIKEHPKTKIFLTEGYVCTTHDGTISNLGRGGSDYSATIIGEAISASEIQIWSDIDGFHNNDPRHVPLASPVRTMSYDEAAELAYFGAKIMHPSSVIPARNGNIPIWLRNTLNPKDIGTIIHGFSKPKQIRAIAAKDDIVVIKIKSSRMLNAYGFLRRLFAVFEKHKTPIDVITTSEVTVSVTIEASNLNEKLLNDLSVLGEVEHTMNQSVICVVGDFSAHHQAVVSSVLNALISIPVRMISYGGSNINVTLVVDTYNKKEAINCLHNQLLEKNGKQKSVEALS